MTFNNIGLVHVLNKKVPGYDFSNIFALRETHTRYRDMILTYLYYLTLAKYYIATQQNNLAIYEYKKAIDIFPNYEDAHYNLAALYWGLSDWHNTIGEFEKVLKLNPNRTDIIKFIDIAKQKL
jgi:tetratricopeptide (TPR) repeat protein